MPTRFEWYAGDDEPVHFKRDKAPKKTKLKNEIEAGQILILLSGRFKGKRVVFLKQLESGLLLVTGPYKINGVPLKRVNQTYAIATSTKINVAGVKFDSITDEFFAKDGSTKCTGEEGFFTADNYSKKVCSDSRKKAQKEIDTVLMKAIKKETHMTKYLNARFSLSKNMKPHALKF